MVAVNREIAKGLPALHLRVQRQVPFESDFLCVMSLGIANPSANVRHNSLIRLLVPGPLLHQELHTQMHRQQQYPGSIQGHPRSRGQQHSHVQHIRTTQARMKKVHDRGTLVLHLGQVLAILPAKELLHSRCTISSSRSTNEVVPLFSVLLGPLASAQVPQGEAALQGASQEQVPQEHPFPDQTPQEHTIPEKLILKPRSVQKCLAPR